MKGIYVLIIKCDRNVTLVIGKLGRIRFIEGLYAYVGSAQNCLERRIERHLKRYKRIFWHIDYLLKSPHVKVLEVFVKHAPQAEECRIAEELKGEGIPVQGFGSSDCKCCSHLFRIEDYAFLKGDMDERSVG